MVKGKKATVSAVKKESNGKKKENDTKNIMVTEPTKKRETGEPPPPPAPLPLLIDEEQDDNKQKDDSLDIDRESRQSEQGVEASIEKEEAKLDNDDDDVDSKDNGSVEDDNNNTAAIVQHRQRMKWRRGLLLISTLAFLLAVSNGYTLYLYKQTQTEKQALVLTAETLREGNMEVSRYYKRQLNRMEKDARHLESQISIYQLRLQKAMLAETEKQRALHDQLHRQMQTERITCEKRLEQEQQAHEQTLQTQRKMSSQQEQDFEQQRVQFKKQTQQVQDEVNAVQSHLQAANEKLALQQAEIKSIQEENEKLVAFKSKATVDLEKGRKANRNLVHEFETCKVQLGTLQKQNDNLTREKNEIQQAMPLLILDLQKCRTENALLLHELNNAQEQLNNEQVHLLILQETVASLGQDLEEEFSHLETISESKEHILRETIATMELERQQFDATLKRTKQYLLKVHHVIDEKLVKANERSIMERKLVSSPPPTPTPTPTPTPPPPPPRREEQKQQDPPRNSSSVISSNISDAPQTDNNQVDIGDSSMDEKESDEEGGDKVTIDHLRQDNDKAADEKDSTVTADDKAADEKDSAATLDGVITNIVSQNIKEKVGDSDATGGAKDEADASMMTDAMIQNGVQMTSDAHGLKADTVEQEPAALNPEESAAFVESTSSPETPVDEAIESMDEEAKTEQDDQQDDATSTADDPSASASTHQTENKGKRHVVNKLQNFWRGLMKRKIDKTTLDLALD